MAKLLITFILTLAMPVVNAAEQAKNQSITYNKRNLFGVTNFKAATFSYLNAKPTTFVYGEQENQSLVDEAPMFYFKQSEQMKEPIKNRKGNGYQLRPVGDLLLIIYDEGVLAEYEEFDLSFSYVGEDNSYTEVFLHNAMGPNDDMVETKLQGIK